MHQVGRELHDAFPTGIRRAQRRLGVCKGLLALGEEVVVTDHVAARIGRHHAGDEQQLTRLDAGDLRVLAERRSELGHIVDLDLRFHRVPSL